MTHFAKPQDSLICLFLVALGLHCCAWAFSSCGQRGLLSSCSAQASRVVASFVAGPGIGAQASADLTHRIGSCGLQALE